MATGALTEEIATNLEEAAEVTRVIGQSRAVGYFFGGLAIGAVTGFYWGYRFNRKKIRAEVLKEAEAEIDEIREVYRRKTKAAQPKPSVDEVLEEKGYSAVVTETERPLKPPVPLIQEPFTRSKEPFAKRTEDGEKSKHDGWSFPAELAQRSSRRIYIIHQDEFTTNETEYSQTTLTYYAGDDVLADEDDTVLNNRENLIGDPEYLTRFGHGTDDFNVLYIRNVQLELEYEICRSPKSYEEEVLGLNGHDQAD